MQPLVLLCGNNEDLVNTRGLVIESAGYKVGVLVGLENLRHYQPRVQIPLTVLCHSFSKEEQDLAIRHLAQVVPESATLVLFAGESSRSAYGTARMEALQGPRALLETINKLTGARLMVGSRS